MFGLYRIAYLSWSMMPTDNGDYARAIQDLLEYSRDWNTDNEVTGMLMFSTGRFAQIIEGEKGLLESLYGRICCDRRHRNVRQLEYGPIIQRAFGGWSMAYTDGNEQLDLCLAEFTISPSSPRAREIVIMLRHLVQPDVMDPPTLQSIGVEL